MREEGENVRLTSRRGVATRGRKKRRDESKYYKYGWHLNVATLSLDCWAFVVVVDVEPNIGMCNCGIHSFSQFVFPFLKECWLFLYWPPLFFTRVLIFSRRVSNCAQRVNTWWTVFFSRLKKMHRVSLHATLRPNRADTSMCPFPLDNTIPYTWSGFN